MEVLEYTDDLDEVRNENFSQVFPELSVLMKDYTPTDWRFILQERINRINENTDK